VAVNALINREKVAQEQRPTKELARGWVIVTVLSHVEAPQGGFGVKSTE
jgi:hypothetical protein